MSRLRFEISISADGYAAGPNQSPEHPLGEGGAQLHEWVLKLKEWRQAHGREGGETNASSEIVAESTRDVGAVIMGRGMFGGGPGPWEESWRGWWGDEPPFRVPVFVLTHHPREPLQMQGGTSFHFVTDGIESALEQARAVAGERNISIGGGAETGRQYLAAGLLDELQLNIAPVLLGAGVRLFENVGAGPKLEQTLVVHTPDVTHIRYAVSRR